MANTFELITMTGEPYTRGTQYGSQAKEKIWQGITRYQKKFKDNLGLDWSSLLARAARFEPLVQSYAPELVEELRGIADGAGAKYEEVLAINCRYELVDLTDDGCTSAVALPEATAGQKVILAQNWDYKPWAMENSVILNIDYGNGTRILGFAEAGQLVRNGFNNHGIGVCANFLRSADDFEGEGVPVTFVRRKLLSCDRFSDALGAVYKASRNVSNNLLVACKEGMAFDLEATPRDVYTIYPQDGIYAHANHIQTPGVIDPYKKNIPDSQYRDKRLVSLLKRKAGSITIQDMMDCLKDHFGYPNAICRHLDERNPDTAIQTNASIVMDLQEGRMFVAYGQPCQSDYVEYSFRR